MIGLGTLLATFVAWSLNKGIPSLWHGHTDRQNMQVTLAKDLCTNHGDCEAQKAIAMQGVKIRKKGE
jgi:hypothetical protein